MNENINLVEKLKNVPKGTKLWSPLCGECTLDDVDEKKIYSIRCMARDNQNVYSPICFTSKGKYTNIFGYSECMLFPSKTNRDWATFKVPKPHKHFEPFQKVLTVTDDYISKKIWAADFFSHYDETNRKYFLISGYYTDEDKIILYKGNEDKLGKQVEE